MKTFPIKNLWVLLLAALLLTSVVLGHDVDRNRMTEEVNVEHSAHIDSYGHLRILAESDLKKLIFDKSKGRVHFTNKETKEDLITLVKEIEEGEQSEDDFKHRVAAAMAKRDAAISSFLARNNKNEKGNEVDIKKSHPEIRLLHKVVMQYCIGCGYAKHFDNIKRELEATLPNIEDVRISGTNYPISFFRLLIGKLCTIMFFSSFIIGTVGQHLRSFLPPRVFEYLVQRRSLIVVLGIVSNLLGNYLMQNGAFEVYVDDKLVYSKLLEGRAPSSEEVYKLILKQTLLMDYP